MIMLDSNGVVYVIDPFKFVTLIQFELPADYNDKIAKLTYCSGKHSIYRRPLCLNQDTHSLLFLH